MVAIVAIKRHQYLHPHHLSSALNQLGRLRWKMLQSSAPERELRRSGELGEVLLTGPRMKGTPQIAAGLS